MINQDRMTRSTRKITYLVLAMIALFMVATAFAQDNTSAPLKNGVRTLYLIRHGAYDFADPQDADTGKALLPLGIAQARMVADRLRSLPVEMTSLVSSTMTRARQTALEINREFPLLMAVRTSLLSECTPETRSESFNAKLDSSNTSICHAKLEQAFARYFVPANSDTNKHDIIVCHGNVIRYFVTKVLDVDPRAWLNMTIDNCGLTVVQIGPDRAMNLVSFNDVGHLPPNLQSRSSMDNIRRKLETP